MRFSKRMGFKPVRNILQIDSMDDALRNGLWNALTLLYWNNIPYNTVFDYFGERYYRRPLHNSTDEFADLILNLWMNYFEMSLHKIRQNWDTVYEGIEKYFFSCEWCEVYDFIEFVPNTYQSFLYSDNNEIFVNYCNIVMEEKLSAYRFVNRNIVRITSVEEITSIEEATTVEDHFKLVSLHMNQALDLLSDRKSPDYRNSIKESISAVEAMCRLITGDEKATLPVALKKLEGNVPLHPALKKAFDSLYGYTSDAGGIRHALSDESNLEFEDAKFMLVTCSAFINYLKAKST